MLAMSIERIFTRTSGRAPQLEHARVRVVAGKGIEGDRYFGRADEPGQNVTFIEAEEIEAFQRALGRPIDLSLTGRNIVTRGVRSTTWSDGSSASARSGSGAWSCVNPAAGWAAHWPPPISLPRKS
jgi:uncharacterized protein YcbX